MYCANYLYVLMIHIVCVIAKLDDDGIKSSARGGHGGGHGGGHSGGHGGGHSGGHGWGHGGTGHYGGRGGGHSSGSYHSYSYNPPSHITHICQYCSHAQTYPVYHGQPPTYVYQYRESSSRYGDLLTGLALYNLGRSSVHHGHSSSDHHSYHTAAPDETCCLQVIDKTHFEQTAIDCMLMSSFLNQSHEIDTFNSSSLKIDITSSGIIVQPPRTENDGSPLQITNDQVCMLWHNRTFVKQRKDVSCTLLKQYAETMKSSEGGVPFYVWLLLLIGISSIILMIVLFYMYYKRNKEALEASPLNHDHVVGYSSNEPPQYSCDVPPQYHCSNVPAQYPCSNVPPQYSASGTFDNVGRS